jgi:hypothetical protein
MFGTNSLPSLNSVAIVSRNKVMESRLDIASGFLPMVIVTVLPGSARISLKLIFAPL